MLALLVGRAPPIIEEVRHLVFDGYQRLFPLERLSHPVTIVVIDEPSLARYGQWPWPRTRVADLVSRIAAAHPAAIGLDLFFPEPDRFSPEAIAQEVPALPAELAAWLARQPSNDARFAEALARAPVVLGIAAGEADGRFPNPPQAAPVRLVGDVRLQNFRGHIQSLEALDRAAKSRGLINAGPRDQVVRHVPYVASVQGSIVPSLGVETLRVALGSPPLALTHREQSLQLQYGDVRARLQHDGEAWLRMGPHAPERFVSAHDVLAGRFNAEMLRDKVVLVGNTGLGLVDFKTTPLGEFVPGVEIHAQIVENLYDGVSLVRPAMAEAIEVAALLVCGLLVIALVPRLTALEGANMVAALVVLLVGGGIVAFRNSGLLFDPVTPTLGLLAVFGTLVVGTLSVTERQRLQLREQAARVAVEMDAARRIQMGLLPDPKESMGGDERVRLAALLEPARTVGGDFYDCFRLDADRVFLVVGDVSGKGLPAALFMAAVKSQIKNAALGGGEPGDILSRAQAEIARENPEQLFVTAFAARFDARTGELAHSNAGHEPPFARGAHGDAERFGSSGGPPLCVAEDFRYPTAVRQLAPGEWVCIVTDGVTEAMNARREFFGAERLKSLLARSPADVTPEALVERIRESVGEFAQGAEIADDITLLALRWESAHAGE